MLLPLTFREEQYNVHNLHVFWCNCLDALGDWFEREGQPDKAEQLDEDVAELLRGEIDPDGSPAYEIFSIWAKREGRRPLLLLDNVDLILNGLHDHDWSLRRALQESGGVVLVGAASTYLEQTVDPKAAFYDFFGVTVLEPLSAEELMTCLRRLADARGEPGKPVLQVLGNDPGRIRTLHALTGGNPRTLTVLYLLLEAEADGDVLRDLEHLLDQVTVLYKARVEDLAPQARVVLDAVALNWDPILAAGVAEITGLEVQAASSQLERLRKAGVLEKVSVSTTSRAAFQLTERFFNIWYLMRHGPRRQRTRLRWLTGFLRGFFSPAQLRERALGVLRGNKALGPECGSYCLALADAVGDRDLGNLLTQQGRELMEQFAKTQGKRIEDLVDPSDLREPSTADEWFGMGWWLHTHLRRYKDAEEAYNKVLEFKQGNQQPSVCNNLGSLLSNHMNRYEEAETAYRKALRLDKGLSYVWENLGLLLTNHIGRYSEAEDAYEKSILFDPDNTYAHGNLLILKYAQPERVAEADESFEAVVSRLPQPEAAFLRAIRALAHDDLGELTSQLELVVCEYGQEISSRYRFVLLRIFRLAALRGLGPSLLSWIDESGFGDQWWPLRTAYDAFLHGEDKLLDVNPEVRGAARPIYDWLDSLRRHQAAAMEAAPALKERKAHRKKRPA